MDSMSTSSAPRAFLLLLIVSFVGTEAAPGHIYEACGADSKNATEFGANSTYQYNLNRLLSSLSANGSSGFRNSTAGYGSGATVYGLSLCRGDLSADVCQDCVAAACRDIVQNCGRVRSAIIWYDECTLRYSNQSILHAMDTSPELKMWKTGYVSGGHEVIQFMRLLGHTWNDVIARAATEQSSPEKFAAEKKDFTGFQTIYTLAQCTPDLKSEDCDQCLRTAVASYGAQGGRVLMPSCNIRYEVYPFYNQTAVATGAPPPSLGIPPPLGPATNHGDGENEKASSTTVIAIVVPIALCTVVLFIGCYSLRSRAKKKYQAMEEQKSSRNEIPTVESLEFGFGAIEAATDYFSTENKIGRGGFGTVYKGTLSNGPEIAVKRLSKSSGQGAREFKNEVELLAKLQHKNLIKLLGFCLKGEEKILIYEFVPNKSLDFFLFDPIKQEQLDWSRRYKIIGGIARGILYLHEDSRLKIIHRDLKASNILLDGDMNPKISDFGLARLLTVNQTEQNTNRIVGTYGYMSPEYAMHGHFSVKSDVFSFGVLILEIISGKKNSNFYHSDGSQDLLSYAWKLWRDGTTLELMDQTLGGTYKGNEVLRCIHISLLCVQEDEAERPTMATVVHFLNSHSLSLPVPKQPAFFVRSSTGSDFCLELGQSSKSIHGSVNEVSITELNPR